MNLQAVYSVTDLARVAGLSAPALVRLLRRGGIEPEGRRQGFGGWVYAADLREQMPRLWASFVRVEAETP